MEISSLPLDMLNWMLQEEKTIDAGERGNKHEKVEGSLEINQKTEYTEKRGQSSDKKDTSWNQEKE